MTPSRSKSIAVIALLTALALIFSYIEAVIPFNVGVPGVKLGVANIVVVIALYIYDWRYALIVNVVRIFLAGFLFSGVFGIIYSMAGGLLSLLVMVLLKRTGLFSCIGICAAGGVIHNLAQLFTAALLVSNLSIFVYFPVLLFSGIVCGLITGTVATIILRRLPDSICIYPAGETRQ
ncbi:MAG: Gx transporter family protein [Firmicutes bacterium]|nr:Gx transporter family protein [Bacillota bacterium]